jgi:nitrite reductase/ring-hydroxylating ferredoxin subunit
MTDTDWQDVGAAADFAARPLTEITVGRTKLALSHRKGVFGVISGVCNHVGGPLGQGRLDGNYVVCPWHNWKFHRVTGIGEPGSEDDTVPSYRVKVKAVVCLRLTPATSRKRKPHAPHPLPAAHPAQTGTGARRRHLGDGADPANPRYSTSEALLEVALAHAPETSSARQVDQTGGVEVSLRVQRLLLQERARLHAACSITQMDSHHKHDGGTNAVHWSDVVLLATPIRWDRRASALLPDGRAAGLRAEPDHDQGPRSSTTKSSASSSRADRTTSKAWPDSCWVFSRSWVFIYRSFRLSHIRAAGRRKTWSKTSPP